MSSYYVERITCPQCEYEAEFLVWNSINTTLDPDMKQKVRSGELFRFTCPECGYEVEVDYATLYHQMEDRVMIYYVREGRNDAANMMKEAFSGVKSESFRCEEFLSRDYRKRVVETKNEFWEKLMILDEGLDDRIIELMKLFMTMELEENGPHINIDEFLFEKTEEGTRRFVIRFCDGKWGYIDYLQDLYDDCEERFREILDVSEESLIIDFNWAVNVIKTMDGDR